MTVYINGKRASKKDIAELSERVRNGQDFILEMSFTKSNNIAIRTI